MLQNMTPFLIPTNIAAVTTLITPITTATVIPKRGRKPLSEEVKLQRARDKKMTKKLVNKANPAT